MDCWSAENATRAYLSTLKMAQRGREPNAAEFISALAAGNNARNMVVACAGAANPAILLGLLAAAHQTGGQVVCVVRGTAELILSEKSLGVMARNVHFAIGDPLNLLSGYSGCREWDFVLVNCNLENHETAVEEILRERSSGGCVVVGYNAFSEGSWRFSGLKTQLLPIGGGLLVSRASYKQPGSHRRRMINVSTHGSYDKDQDGLSGLRRNSHWVVEVDKSTGEEHVFRIRSARRLREIQA